MRDGATNEPPNDWARLLREITDRPGWSIARLARESGIHRSTIFRWLDPEAGSKPTGVTVRSVNLIADAAGISREVALRAAGAALDAEDINGDLAIELETIDESDLPPRVKERLKSEARKMHERQAAERRALAERQARERREQMQTWFDIASGGDPQPAT